MYLRYNDYHYVAIIEKFSMNTSQAPIGVFDSGMGGLTVLAALREHLPYESFIYLGDTARLPYGTKDADTVVRYATQATTALVARGIKLLVIACNTATAAALPALQQAFAPLPVIGVIDAGAKAAAIASHTGQILVLATEITTRQGAYERAIKKYKPQATVQGQACSLFVALAEECWFDGDAALAIANQYLQPYLNTVGDFAPDTVVLGCTHFPVFIPLLARLLGNHVALVDSAQTTAHAVNELLVEKKLKNQDTVNGQCAFLATDGVERFARVASCFLRTPFQVHDVEIINL